MVVCDATENFVLTKRLAKAKASLFSARVNYKLRARVKLKENEINLLAPIKLERDTSKKIKTSSVSAFASLSRCHHSDHLRYLFSQRSSALMALRHQHIFESTAESLAFCKSQNVALFLLAKSRVIKLRQFATTAITR